MVIEYTVCTVITLCIYTKTCVPDLWVFVPLSMFVSLLFVSGTAD